MLKTVDVFRREPAKSIEFALPASRRYVGGFDLSAIFARAQNEQTNEMACVRKARTWNVRRGRFVVGTCNDAVCKRARESIRALVGEMEFSGRLP